MIATLLPWIAIVVALAAVFARTKPSTEAPASKKLGKSAHMAGGFCVLVGVIAFLVGYLYKDKATGVFQPMTGALIGMIFATASGFLGSRFDPSGENRWGGFGLGVAAVGIGSLVGKDALPPTLMGVVAGLAMGSVILSLAPTQWPSLAAIAAGACASLSAIGSFLSGTNLHSSGLAIGIGVTIVGVLSQFAFAKDDAKSANLRLLAVVVLGSAAVWLLAQRYLFLGDIATIFAIGAATAAVVAWIVPAEDSNSSAPGIVAIIIWLAVATIAFGMRQGLGMATALAGATTVLIASGNRRALLTVGPLAAVVVFRLLRNMYPGASRAFDIGVHYSLIGFIAGVAAVLLFLEWRQSVKGRADSPVAVSNLLWVGAFMLIPVLSAILIAAKGYVGVIVGVGFGSAIAYLKGESNPLSLSVQWGIGSAMLMQYAWLESKLNLTRSEKIQSLVIFAIVMAAIGLGITFLSRKSGTSAQAIEA